MEREEGVMGVMERMRALPVGGGQSNEGALNLLQASAVVVNRAFRDNVSSVLTAGILLLRMILTEYLVKHR